MLPYKSKNIDLSAEWYYSNDSYISAGFFHKKVRNFISQTQVNMPAFGLGQAGKLVEARGARQSARQRLSAGG